QSFELILRASRCRIGRPSGGASPREKRCNHCVRHWRSTMKLPRRQFLQLAASAAALPALSPMVWAQAYPSRPITMVVPFPGGGISDAVGRVLAEGMRGSLGQPIIIENVSGADGSIGTGRVARARPDGYTIELGGTSPHMMNGAFYSLPYDVVNDF